MAREGNLCKHTWGKQKRRVVCGHLHFHLLFDLEGRSSPGDSRTIFSREKNEGHKYKRGLTMNHDGCVSSTASPRMIVHLIRKAHNGSLDGR